ncbi:hypothetical protein EDI_060450 [Entamoeba dispar SAW760]|uniref:VPS9 domain-containing protein n=1 Tax=Entamoeba dispar (strain ATCC PRA-260 / SAW760) TaxID=370354 RepID=B0E738_ENTDS|nr:uncharacterized protein EDI_060450 [Entamoeba dispar SAW760]EDR29649.1 hypothetical protein EDI_060450 [Entamoeba dispar SAW760]|eukprot:EDR29649.1 hypothetical protein EDI_060450 [Entamoeba dispar SAW760]
MDYFINIQLPEISISEGIYSVELKREYLEKLMKAKLSSCDLLQRFGVLENEINEEIELILNRVKIGNEHFQFSKQEELRIAYGVYQNTLLELLKFKKEIIEYHSSIIEKFIENNNSINNKVSSGTIINNIDFYCLMPSTYISYLTSNTDEIESKLNQLIKKKDQEKLNYETLFTSTFGYSTEKELKDIIKELKIIDKETYIEIQNNEELQKRFNKIIFNLNNNIGIQIYTYIESIKLFKNNQIQLISKLKNIQIEIIKSLLNSYNIDQSYSDLLLILFHRALCSCLGSFISSIPIQILPLSNQEFIQKQQQLLNDNSIHSFPNFHKFILNTKLNEFIHSIDFTQLTIPYDFILSLNSLFDELIKICNIDISGDTIIPVIVYLLLHSSIPNINLLICFIDLFTPPSLIKGKLSYTTTTFKAALNLIIQQS